MRVSAVLLISTLVTAVVAHDADPDIGRGMVAIVQSHGYSIQRHFVTTADGYILQVFRIPTAIGESSAPSKIKPVVLLQHALLDSSWAYVANQPHQSLGYLLADAGYDVWFGNNRGNVYSTNHTSFPLDSKEFWDFSYDEMALLDLPATVDYILATTKVPTLSYIGHSEGTIQAFAGFSRSHELASKVNLFLAMAPVAFVHHQRGFFLNAAADLHSDFLAQVLGVKQYLTNQMLGGLIKAIAPEACHLLANGCDFILELICGPSQHLNRSRIDVYVSETPAGTSVKNMVHWFQSIRHPTFSMYDYGSKGNMIHYNSTKPPPYLLEDMTVPTVLVTGSDDYLADPADVATLEAALNSSGNGALVSRINVPSYAHLDFTWAEDAHMKIYPDMLALLHKFNNMA